MAIELTLEEQIAALTTSNQTLTKEVETKEKALESLTKSNQALTKEVEARDKALLKKDNTIGTLEQTVEKQKRDLAEKVETIRNMAGEAEATEKVIAGYEAKLRAVQAQATGGAPVVEHKGQLYRVISPEFHFEGKKVTAESLASDASLVAKLVELGAGVLEKVEEEEATK